jgi:hypothetical protein
MSIYEPDIKIYYGPIDPEYRLIPAPNIAIALNYNYSNDTIIGYSYNITLTGQATALDLRDLNYGDEIINPTNYNVGGVADHINKLRKILSQNGNILQVVKGSDDSHILKARGGILRSFNVEESPNNWIHYANYTAIIEFQTIDFMGNSEDCGSTFLDPSTFATGAGIVDINKYKIKSFEDGWTFSFDENEAFSRVQLSDVGYNLNINNDSFNIQYKISAIGKHHYVYDDDTNPDPTTNTLLPAWEQAKNFVQYRLHNQITNLLNGVLKNTYTSGCSSTDNLSSINIPGSSQDGLLKDIGDNKYTICNEEITCESSESDGSFSATYSAVVKNKIFGSWSSSLAKHSITKSIRSISNGGSIDKEITVEGTIEGLVEGGLIKNGVPLTLPSEGSLFIYNDGNSNKYTNALSLWDDNIKYMGGESEKRGKDLSVNFKNSIGVTLAELGRISSPTDTRLDPPHPTSFNLTHDYNKGIINYTIVYSSSSTCGRKYRELSVSISNPINVYASFTIPNSNSGPLIQFLNTKTAKKININIQGYETKQDDINFNSLINCEQPDYPVDLPYVNNLSILTSKTITRNLFDGSFSIGLSYICNQQEPCSV